MRRHRIIMFALFAVFLLSPAERAEAATTLNVTTTTDELAANANCSLREAIQNANDGAATYSECGAWGGAPATINLPAGTYTTTIGVAGEDLNATGDFDITKSVAIVGAGAGATTIDGGGLDRVFHIDPVLGGGLVVSISGVTIQGGNAGASYGGGINNEAGTDTLTVTNSRKKENTSAQHSPSGI